MAAISSSFTTGLPSSKYSFKNCLMEGITSCQSSVSFVLVSVTKLLAIKTDFIKGKLNSSMAKGDGVAVDSSWKSILLPGYNNLLATNFMVSGLGVISVYMLITGLPVLIIFIVFNVAKLISFKLFVVPYKLRLLFSKRCRKAFLL